MDDWVILATNRHKLRKGIALVNRVLNQLTIDKHPDKTWMGKISRGFACMDVGKEREQERQL